MSLIDVEHQGFAQRLIQRAIAGDRIPHAYLFHGPGGVGKEALARGVAQLLLCAEPMTHTLEGQRAERIGLSTLRTGCGRCDDCRTVSASTHPDLHLIYRQLNRDHPDADVRKRKALDIGVDVLRHFVIAKTGLTPRRNRAKVFLIREADRITPQAQNALLKTLEEPPGTTFIILLVTALDRMLPTTLSRCQTVRFDALPVGFVHDKLAALLPDQRADHVRWYARCSDGSIGQALSWAQDDLFARNERIIGDLAALCGARSAGGAAAEEPAPPRGTRHARASASGIHPGEVAARWMDEAKQLGARYARRDPDITDTEATRTALRIIFRLAANWYADVVQLQHDRVDTVRNVAWLEALKIAAERLSTDGSTRAVRRAGSAESQLDRNANTQLVMDTLVNDLARVGRGAPMAA